MQQIKVLQQPLRVRRAALQDGGNVLCHRCNMDKPKSLLCTGSGSRALERGFGTGGLRCPDSATGPRIALNIAGDGQMSGRDNGQAS